MKLGLELKKTGVHTYQFDKVVSLVLPGPQEGLPWYRVKYIRVHSLSKHVFLLNTDGSTTTYGAT